MNGGVEENIVEVPNPGSGDTIPGNLGIVVQTDVVEEVHHDAGVPALGKNVPSEFGMDDGNAEEDVEPTIVVKKEDGMSNRINLTNPTSSSNFVMVKGKDFSHRMEYDPTSFLNISW